MTREILILKKAINFCNQQVRARYGSINIKTHIPKHGRGYDLFYIQWDMFALAHEPEKKRSGDNIRSAFEITSLKQQTKNRYLKGLTQVKITI